MMTATYSKFLLSHFNAFDKLIPYTDSTKALNRLIIAQADTYISHFYPFRVLYHTLGQFEAG